MPTPARLTLALLLACGGLAHAMDDRSVTWTEGPITATAKPLIVTASNPPTGGDRLADPADPATTGGVDSTGVARLFLDTNPSAGFGSICSASLLEGGEHLLTAAHCVTDETGALTVLDGGDGNSATFFTAGGPIQVAFDAADVAVHPSYNGDLLDGFDVAVIDLGAALPSTVARYALDDGSADDGAVHLAAGYGQSGDGATGSTLGAGQLRSGSNNYLSQGLPLAGITNRDTQLTADFDSGAAANDAFAVFDAAVFGTTLVDPVNGGLGLGADEVGIAPGDSGGPTFLTVGGEPVIAGVHSYGLRLQLTGGVSSDVDSTLNSTFGEFYGDARVAAPTVLSFIESFLPAPLIPGDADADGDVDLDDLDILATNFDSVGVTGGASVGDFNNDAAVDLDDLDILATNFGFAGSAAPASTPEPSGLALVAGLAAAATAGRAQRRSTSTTQS